MRLGCIQERERKREKRMREWERECISVRWQTMAMQLVMEMFVSRNRVLEGSREGREGQSDCAYIIYCCQYTIILFPGRRRLIIGRNSRDHLCCFESISFSLFFLSLPLSFFSLSLSLTFSLFILCPFVSSVRVLPM